MFALLNVNDFILAAITAALLTWGIIGAAGLARFAKTSAAGLAHKNKDLEAILEKCYVLFPKEILQFNGEIIKRGMSVKIITNQNKIFEGKFLGFNSDDIICLMTKRFIIAHALININEIEKI